ncbi:MAG: xanthine dehydrogenase family protein molybdopterin-binding subunit, partial [Sciscionella sp.]
MTSRLDGPLKVTGKAKYGADHNLPGMAYGYVVLSTIANGEIESMDVTAARGAAGVLGVYTPFDPLELRTPATPMLGETWVPLQDKEVAYYGQPIGFVVAETFEQAREAASLVGVSYHVRPALTSLQDGMAAAEDAPSIMDGSPAALEILAPGVESIEDALAQSPVVVDATYTTASQNHAAMEPHSAVAVWSSGGLTVHSGTQGSNMQVTELAAALDVDPSSIHAVNPFVGGAFGGKGRTSITAFLAAAAARVLGRGVKAVLSREQVFTATANRAATVQRISLGALSDGTLVALRHDSWCSTPVDRSFTEQTSHGTSREWYTTQNLSISQKVVPLNIPPTTFMRAPGEAPGSFALESAIDELAVALNMDPIALRQRNDSASPSGSELQWSSKHLEECFDIGAARFGWAQRTPQGRADGDWLVGLGTATAMFPALRFPATVEVRLRADDTAVVATSGADPGTGLLTVL